MRKLTTTFVLINVLSVLACKPADHHKKPLRYIQSDAQGKALPETLSTDTLPDYKKLGPTYDERFTVDANVKPDESLATAPGSATLPIADHVTCLPTGWWSSFQSKQLRQENVYPNLPKAVADSLNATTNSSAVTKRTSDDTIRVDVTTDDKQVYSYSEKFQAPGSADISVPTVLAGKAKVDSPLPYTCYDGLSSTNYAPAEGGYIVLQDGTKSAATRITKSVVGKVICQSESKTDRRIHTIVYDYARSIEVEIYAHQIGREGDPCVKGARVYHHHENLSFEGKSLRVEHYELLGVSTGH